MKRRIILGVAVLVLAALACSTVSIPGQQVIGSGKVVGEQRNLAEFQAVELAGSAHVGILLSDTQTVNVEADDNILPLIETKVVNGTLIVSTKPGVNYTTSHDVTVTVGMKSLKSVALTGSGSITVGAMTGPDLSIRLLGSGNVTAEGTVDHVSISLPGSGNVHCEALKAKAADATINGSGDIEVFASESLNASIVGSGTIHYTGNPAQVTKNVSGSGNISP